MYSSFCAVFLEREAALQIIQIDQQDLAGSPLLSAPTQYGRTCQVFIAGQTCIYKRYLQSKNKFNTNLNHYGCGSGSVFKSSRKYVILLRTVESRPNPIKMFPMSLKVVESNNTSSVFFAYICVNL